MVVRCWCCWHAPRLICCAAQGGPTDPADMKSTASTSFVPHDLSQAKYERIVPKTVRCLAHSAECPLTAAACAGRSGN